MMEKRTFHILLQQKCDAHVGDEIHQNRQFAADILKLASREADRWTKRRDDAIRIPNMLDDAALFLLGTSDQGEL